MELAFRRFGGYLIDVSVIALLGLIAGYRAADMTTARMDALFGLVSGGYLLLRDVGAASLGKLILGLRVVRAEGGSIAIGPRIARNITIALGPAFAAVTTPDTLAANVGGIVAGLVLFAEAICLVQTGRRLGDRIGGTTVIRRAAG